MLNLKARTFHLPSGFLACILAQHQQAMIAYDRYTEYLSKQIYKTITPTEQQIAARVYKSCGLTR